MSPFSVTFAGFTIRHLPGHASREIVTIIGSLTTCDPGNIIETFEVFYKLNFPNMFTELAVIPGTNLKF